MILITREYGFMYAAIFGIFGDLIPTVISGDEIDGTVIFYFCMFIVVAFASSFVTSFSITTTGIVCSILLGISGLIFSAYAQDSEGVFETITHVGCTLVYFFLLGNFVYWLL